MRGKEGIRCGSGGASPSSLMIVAAAPWYLVSVEPSQCYFLLLLQLSMPLLPTYSPPQVCDSGCWFKILKWVLGTLLSPAISQPSPSSLNFAPRLPSRTITMSRKSASSPPTHLKQELVRLIFVQKWWPIHLPKYPCSCCQCQWAIAESYKETEVNPKTISAIPKMHSYLWSQLQRKLKGIISHFVSL